MAASLAATSPPLSRLASMRTCVPMELASDSARRKTWKASPRSAGVIALKRCRIGSIFLALAAAQSKPVNAGRSMKNRCRREFETRRKNEVGRKTRALVASKITGSVPRFAPDATRLGRAESLFCADNRRNSLRISRRIKYEYFHNTKR